MAPIAPSTGPSTAAPTARGGQSTARRWLGLVVISVAVSLIIVDSTIVNVAIPSIIDDLGISSAQVQWVQESYTLVFAALLILFGTIADRVGRRRLLLVGVSVFVLASVLAAFAPTGELLIGARIIQGIGGAMVLPSTLSLINATFHGRERGIAFAVWGSTIGGMVALGPLLGGWLTTAYTWRLAFGINVPLGILVIAGALVFVIESRESVVRTLDPVGALLSVLMTASLVYGLIEGRNLGWWLPADNLELFGWRWPLALSPIPLMFAVTVLSALAFVAWGLRRRRRGRDPMIDFSLFAIGSFRNGNIAALVVALGELGVVLVLPIWLQNILGYTALETGLFLLSLAIGSFMASGVAGGLANRVAAASVVRMGIGAEIVGVLGIAIVISPQREWGWLVVFLFAYGFGIGLATAQLTSVILRDVPLEKSGQASGTQSTARQVGSALGIAILGTVLFSGAGAVLTQKLDGSGMPAAQRDAVVSAVVDSSGAAIAGLEERPGMREVADTARQAFSDATKYAAFSAAGFLALGFLATLSLGGEPPVAPAASGAVRRFPRPESRHKAPLGGGRARR